MFKTFACGLAALAFAMPAAAQTNLEFGGTFGTLGLGPQLSYRSAHIGVRADATFLTLKGHVSSSDTRYKGRADLRSGGMWLDLYPFGGRFHVSAGARYNGNKGQISATPTQSTSIGGFVFTPQQIGTIDGRVSTRDFAPAASIGIGSKPKAGFTWRFEGGALFQGKMRLSPLTSSTGMIPQARLAAERDDLQHDLSKYRVFPVVQLELGWRF